MTRVLFCVIPEKGHVNPYIGPAQAALASGAEVVFWSPADISEQLAAAGIEHFVGPRDVGPPQVHRGAEFAANVRDPAWLRSWIKSLLLDAVPGAIESVREILRDLRPDVVALDPMLYAAAIASELESIPWASISNSLNPVLPGDLDSELLRTVRWLAPERDTLFASYGLRPQFRGCDLLSPHLTTAFTTEALTGEVPGVDLVGPSLPLWQRGDETPFPWGRLDPDLPLVYMSLGSQISHQPRLFRRVIEGARGRRVQLVLSASDLADSPDLGELPPNVIAVPYAPQLDLLRRTAAFITHGGANSFMEAITFGVPLLLMPLCNDQFHQAHFVRRTGIGRTLDRTDLSTTDLRQALEALLADGPERQRMSNLSTTYTRNGATETARRLLELATHP